MLGAQKNNHKNKRNWGGIHAGAINSGKELEFWADKQNEKEKNIFDKNAKKKTERANEAERKFGGKQMKYGFRFKYTKYLLHESDFTQKLDECAKKKENNV